MNTDSAILLVIAEQRARIANLEAEVTALRTALDGKDEPTGT